MIFIDADACPVRQEAIDIALRHQIRLVMVTNGGVRPYPHALIDMKYVSQGPDEADKWIADSVDTGVDLVEQQGTGTIHAGQTGFESEKEARHLTT